MQLHLWHCSVADLTGIAHIREDAAPGCYGALRTVAASGLACTVQG
jgi:hypothetical protein